jgi:hypothetical protein
MPGLPSRFSSIAALLTLIVNGREDGLTSRKADLYSAGRDFDQLVKAHNSPLLCNEGWVYCGPSREQ